MNAFAPVVSTLALSNELVLLWIDEHGAPESKTALAAEFGRDQSNFSKTLRGLADEGVLTDAAALTDLGRDVVAALRRMRGTAGLVDLDPALIDDNRFQPRKVAEDEADAEMVVSVREKGVLQPIRVRPIEGGRYEQAFGHRRKRAAQAAGCKVPAIVSDLTDDQMMELAGVENLQRANLHWVDEAEYYLMLAEHGRSASRIVAIVGEGGRSKRKVQELIQFARELSDDDKARARLPKGHPQGLSVEQCRDLVGNKAPKLALDLPAKTALALVEILDAAEREGRPIVGAKRVVRLFEAPTGGPIHDLVNARKLAEYAFDGPALLLKVSVTEDVAKYLNQVGFDTDRATCLFKARAEVVGEMAAAVFIAGEYHTAQLNPPPEPMAPAAPVAEPEPAEPRADLDEEAEWNSAAPQPAEPPAPAAAPAVPEPRPHEQLILIEIAHRIGAAGIDHGTWRAEVGPDWYKDPKAPPMVQGRLVAFMPLGAKATVTLASAGIAWLKAQEFAFDETGKPGVSDTRLWAAQEALGIRPVDGDLPYLTTWLNPPAAPQAAGTPGAPPNPEGAAALTPAAAPFEPTPAAPPPAQPAHEISRQIGFINGEARAMAALAHAVREGNGLLMAAKSRKLTAAEIDQRIALGEAALEQAAKYLEE